MQHKHVYSLSLWAILISIVLFVTLTPGSTIIIFFNRSSKEIRKIACLSHGRFSLIMHTNVCDVFAPYSCTLTPLGCTLSFSLKKTYVLGFAFYSPIPKHPPCIFIVFFAFLCREPAMHPTGALVCLHSGRQQGGCQGHRKIWKTHLRAGRQQRHHW